MKIPPIFLSSIFLSFHVRPQSLTSRKLSRSLRTISTIAVQRVAERFFSAFLRVPLRLCVKPGLAPREKDFPRAAGSVCSPHSLCGGRPEMNDKTSLIQPEQIKQVILLVRGQRVIIAFDMPNWHFKPIHSWTI